MGSSNDVTAIPLIDVAPLVKKIDDPDMANDKDLLRVVLTLDYACKELDLLCASYEEKMKIKMTRQSGYRGYQKLGENVTKEKRDMHEAVNKNIYIAVLDSYCTGKYGDLGKTLEGDNLWPEYPSNLKVVLENYISLVKGRSNS
ncbi:putative 2-oxoglutarate-dependent dioxygenase [Zea mays]|uniref:Putative 2-oxoglutarate-dependent dioxygenase n=1 Tax=Zea mays TaxID=4577 RepID=A0A3L6GD93_MAIZE|nr:putative 2-oxoglutarate-dependent dioxygenase [Zea mays]